MGVLAWVMQGSFSSFDRFAKSFSKPFIFGQMSSQMWCFRQCILLPIQKSDFCLWQSHQTTRFMFGNPETWWFQQVPSKAFIPIAFSEYQKWFSIFHFSSGFLTYWPWGWNKNNNAVWLAGFLAWGGMLTMMWNSMARWKGSKNFKRFGERNDDGDVKG